MTILNDPTGWGIRLTDSAQWEAFRLGGDDVLDPCDTKLEAIQAIAKHDDRPDLVPVTEER